MKRKTAFVLLPVVIVLIVVFAFVGLWFATAKPPQRMPSTRIGLIFMRLRYPPPPTPAPDLNDQKCIEEYREIADQLPQVVMTQVAEGAPISALMTSDDVWYTASEELGLQQFATTLLTQHMTDGQELYAMTWCGYGGTDVFVISGDDVWHLATTPVGWETGSSQYNDLIVITAYEGRVRRTLKVWIAERQNADWVPIYEAEHRLINLDGSSNIPEVEWDTNRVQVVFTLDDGTQIDRAYQNTNQGWQLVSNNDSEPAE